MKTTELKLKLATAIDVAHARTVAYHEAALDHETHEIPVAVRTQARKDKGDRRTQRGSTARRYRCSDAQAIVATENGEAAA